MSFVGIFSLRCVFFLPYSLRILNLELGNILFTSTARMFAISDRNQQHHYCTVVFFILNWPFMHLFEYWVVISLLFLFTYAFTLQEGVMCKLSWIAKRKHFLYKLGYCYPFHLFLIFSNHLLPSRNEPESSSPANASKSPDKHALNCWMVN